MSDISEPEVSNAVPMEPMVPAKPLTLRELAVEVGFPKRALVRFVKLGMRHIHIGKTIYSRREWYREFLALNTATVYTPRSTGGRKKKANPRRGAQA